MNEVETVHRRTLANRFLLRWNRYGQWGLLAVLISAFFLPLAGVLIAALVILAGVTAAALVITWVKQPTAYESACQLDAAAGLKDRISTALHCASIASPDPMILHQRQDALEHLQRVQPKALFPIRIPATAGRTLLLVAVVAGFMAYRGNHRSPFANLLASSTQARAAAGKPPLTFRQLEARLKKLILGEKDGVAGAEGQPQSGQGLSAKMEQPPPEEPQADQKNSSDTADPQQDASEASQEDASEGQPQSDPGQQGDNPQGSQPQQADNSPAQGDSQKGDQQQSPDRKENQANSPQPPSLAQRIQQALKDLMAKASGQTPPQGEQSPQQGDQPSNSQPSQQGQNQSSQPGQRPANNQGDANANANGGEPGQQPGTGDRPNGGRGIQQQAPGDNSMSAKAGPDVVPLSMTNFQGDARIHTTTEPGKAKVPERDTAPRPMATTNGAEQGDVPLRYRTYVQRYFDRENKARR